MRILFPAAVALAVVAAPGAARDLNAAPAATPAGKPQSCIPLRNIRETLVRNDRVIDFRMTGGRYYRVTLDRRCPQLGFERRFSYATSLSQLCQQDIITVLVGTTLTPGASCGLAPFQPVTLAK